jgi:cell division protein FtsW
MAKDDGCCRFKADMARKLKSDKVLFITTVLLVCVGVVMVYSASAALGNDRFGSPYRFLTRQVMWAMLGFAALAIVMRVDYRTYREPVFIWTTLGLVTCALLAVLFSPPVNNARRWFAIGGLGIQPSEFAKLSAIFFVAAFLERRIQRVNEFRYTVLPILVVILGLVGLIVPEPDLGTSMTVALIAAVMVFGAGLNYRYFIGLLVGAVPAIMILVATSPYRTRRITSFWNPWADQLDNGFQVIQSLIAVGTGGVSGRGLMQGVQKLFFLPEPHTDFIYSVIAEELGLIGAVLVLLCFCVIAWRGLRVAVRAADPFGALLALGLTTMMAVQALVNISVVLGLMPTKGIPLPFVSAGGSSLLVNLLGMGVLLNVSQHTAPEA